MRKQGWKDGWTGRGVDGRKEGRKEGRNGGIVGNELTHKRQRPHKATFAVEGRKKEKEVKEVKKAS